MNVKKAADELTFADACTCVVPPESSELEDKPEDTEIKVESFTQDNTYYDISLKRRRLLLAAVPPILTDTEYPIECIQNR
ncbi:hypothetical protein M422DRAFT_249602 [Sphaerobolus stellatus SS14]|uniref:Uncharacterized protein n=1 Tax=Sphaerobolus stellatus (strain SS14) TaxID=990650 RepID=A0A0C9VV01_SPHS4|nr:hypothetical protein M422DRAFT_249602 [Sphaerobolus stellatus SS14]